LGSFHKYAECANKGICNRQTGECECFEGYEGKGCQRTSCPNDCSGHGTCEYIENLGFADSPFQTPLVSQPQFLAEPETFVLRQWDNYKTRGCVCDPEFGDIDCSKRMCPYGNDQMDRRVDLAAPLKYQVQKIDFNHEDDLVNEYGSTFAITFKTQLNETFTTTPILFQCDSNAHVADFVSEVQDALLRLPNRVIDKIEVHGDYLSANNCYLNVTFIGENTQGPQNLLVVESYECLDGCTPKISGLNLEVDSQTVTQERAADYNSYECGRRGKCDYDTGLCQCFSGFSGAACNSCTALI